MKEENKKINLKEFSILLSILYIFLTIAAIISQTITLSIFNLQASLFFSLTDYLSSSLYNIVFSVFLLLYILFVVEKIISKIINFFIKSAKLPKFKLHRIKTTKLFFTFIIVFLAMLFFEIKINPYTNPKRIMLFIFFGIMIFLYIYGKHQLVGQTIIESFYGSKKIKKNAIIFVSLLGIIFILGMSFASLNKVLSIKTNKTPCYYKLTLDTEILENTCIITKSNDYIIVLSKDKNAIAIQKSSIIKIENKIDDFYNPSFHKAIRSNTKLHNRPQYLSTPISQDT